MTKDEIIEMAKQAGVIATRIDGLEAFAKLVATKALAQPEDHRRGSDNQKVNKQEPVAWATREDFYRELDRSINRMRQQMEIKGVVMRCADYDIALPVIDIREGHVLVGQVITPAQRKPLTDEQLKPLIQKAMMYYGHNPDHWLVTAGAGFCILARAIEAAHGIKEKNT